MSPRKVSGPLVRQQDVIAARMCTNPMMPDETFSAAGEKPRVRPSPFPDFRCPAFARAEQDEEPEASGSRSPLGSHQSAIVFFGAREKTGVAGTRAVSAGFWVSCGKCVRSRRDVAGSSFGAGLPSCSSTWHDDRCRGRK